MPLLIKLHSCFHIILLSSLFILITLNYRFLGIIGRDIKNTGASPSPNIAYPSRLQLHFPVNTSNSYLDSTSRVILYTCRIHLITNQPWSTSNESSACSLTCAVFSSSAPRSSAVQYSAANLPEGSLFLDQPSAVNRWHVCCGRNAVVQHSILHTTQPRGTLWCLTRAASRRI